MCSDKYFLHSDEKSLRISDSGLPNCSNPIRSTVEYIASPEYFVGCYEKKFGIILYNPSDREGAVEEADNLQSGLQAVGCQVFREEWTTKVQLNMCMADGLRVADGCSVLIVCVMSHGTAGTLRSEDGDGAVIINDVIFRFQREIPDDTPVVSFE